jgi:hypothetical protein
VLLVAMFLGCRGLVEPGQKPAAARGRVSVHVTTVDGKALVGAQVFLLDAPYVQDGAGRSADGITDDGGFVDFQAGQDSLVDLRLHPPLSHGGPPYRVLSVDVTRDSVEVVYPLEPLERKLQSVPGFEIVSGTMRLWRYRLRSAGADDFHEQYNQVIDSLGTVHGWWAPGRWEVSTQLINSLGESFEWELRELVDPFAGQLSAVLGNLAEMDVDLGFPEGLPADLQFSITAVGYDPADGARVEMRRISTIAGWTGRASFPRFVEHAEVDAGDDVLVISKLATCTRDPAGPLRMGPLRLGEFRIDVEVDPAWPVDAEAGLRIDSGRTSHWWQSLHRGAPTLLLLDPGAYRARTYADDDLVRDEVWGVYGSGTRILSPPD